jgi:hypothetical protein
MNITGKYLKVWKIEEKNGFLKVDLGDSKKNKDGSYENWTWFNCTLMGNAKTANISVNDVVEIKSGIISKRKYNEKYYDDIVIFDIEVMQRQGNQQDYSPKTDPKYQGSGGGFADDIPFSCDY